MMFLDRKIIIMFVIIIFPALTVFAEKLYVSDRRVVNLREGPGVDNNIVKPLISGTSLEFIEENGKFIKVKTKTGEEGWILKKYTTSEIPASVIIKNLKKKLNQLENKTAKIEGEKIKLDKEFSLLNSNFNEVNEKYNSLRNNSENVVEIVSSKKILKKKIIV